MFLPLALWEFHSLREERDVTADVGKSTIQAAFPAHEGRVGGQRLQAEASTAYDLAIDSHIHSYMPSNLYVMCSFLGVDMGRSRPHALSY